MTEMLHRSATSKCRRVATGALLASLLAGVSACGSESASVAANSGKEAPAASGETEAQSGGQEQVFHIATLHLDAKTNVKAAGDHGAEPFPATAPKSTRGFIVKAPDSKGEWSVRVFVFQPAQVVVQQGDPVVLNFIGVQGPAHTIAIDGQRERLSLKRGEMKTVRFVAEQPGVIKFISVGREPTMQGSVLVLPRGGA